MHIPYLCVERIQSWTIRELWHQKDLQIPASSKLHHREDIAWNMPIHSICAKMITILIYFLLVCDAAAEPEPTDK